jgi:hypothetical protein
MRDLFLVAGVAVLIVALGCGSGGGPRPVVIGTNSNGSLKGQYVYQISGNDLSSGSAVPYREAGIFNADGSGHITSGTDDFCENSTCQSANPVTGSYNIASDGIGSLSLSTGINLTLSLVNSSQVYLIEADATASAAGIAELQSTSALSTVPSGTFTFRMHPLNLISSQSSSMAGVMTISGGAVSGSEDVLRSSTFDNNTRSPLTITGGTFNAPSNGRGMGSITDSSNVTSTFIYYMVDANHLRFLLTGAGMLGVGRAEIQSGGPFSNASLSGAYAFGSRGDDGSFLFGVNTAGSLIADGKGNISTGAYDSVQDGNPRATNLGFSGSYAMAPNGRAAITLNPSGGAAIQQVFWIVSPSRAFFLTNASTKVEDGTADLQQSGSISNASLSGQYAFVMDGFDLNANALVDRVGWIKWNGNGGLSWNESVNNSGILSGSYSVGSNGRVTATVNNLSLSNHDLVFYLVSGSTAYVLQNDSGVEAIGFMGQLP